MFIIIVGKTHVENAWFYFELIEKRKETCVLHWNRLKTQGKHVFCVGTNGKRKENTAFALEHIEIIQTNQVL